MGTPVDQLRSAALGKPTNVGLADSNASQSDTRPGLSAASETAALVEHEGPVDAGEGADCASADVAATSAARTTDRTLIVTTALPESMVLLVSARCKGTVAVA